MPHALSPPLQWLFTSRAGATFFLKPLVCIVIVNVVVLYCSAMYQTVDNLLTPDARRGDKTGGAVHRPRAGMEGSCRA